VLFFFPVQVNSIFAVYDTLYQLCAISGRFKEFHGHYHSMIVAKAVKLERPTEVAK